MLSINFQTLVILFLIGLIIGMMMGVSLTRDRY